MSGSPHAGRLHDLATQFREFLIHQTNVELDAIGVAGTARGPAALRAALERLDAALSQLADLESVYADTPTASLEPLVFPIAALTGEYIRHILGGEWLEPEDAPPGADTLPITTGGETFDLLAVVRPALLAAGPNLAALVREQT